MVNDAIEERTFGILGEPRVNVLQLNLALNRQFGAIPDGQPNAAAPEPTSTTSTAPK